MSPGVAFRPFTPVVNGHRVEYLLPVPLPVEVVLE